VEWEALARDFLGEICAEPPIDAFALARAAGLEVRLFLGGGAVLDAVAGAIYVPARARLERQHGQVAHELGHWLLARAGEPDDELAARYLAGALLVPREALDRDLRARGWSLRALRERHPHASLELLARRVTQVRPATVTVVDQGRVTARAASPWLRPPGPAAPWEVELAADAVVQGIELLTDRPAVAAPAVADGWRRAVVVAARA